MVEGEQVGRDIVSVTTSGIRLYSINPRAPVVTITSQSDMTSQPHETKFNIKEPNDCEELLGAIRRNPKLQQSIEATGHQRAISIAIDHLAETFGKLSDKDRKRLGDLIGEVGRMFPASNPANSPVIASATAACQKAGMTNIASLIGTDRIDSRYERETGQRITR